MFWRRTTSPSFISATAFLALSPTTLSSAAKTTSLPSFSERLFATGARESDGTGSPFGLPICEQRITLAPLSIRYLIVGSAPTIRFSSVILPSASSGTLKSQRTKTFLPFTSTSSTVNLLYIVNFSFFMRTKLSDFSWLYYI